MSELPQVRRGHGLYVHVPFCASKCPYCSFYSIPLQAGEVQRYAAALESEMRLAAAQLADSVRFCTLYIGGGTPSVLPAGTLAQLVESLLNAFPFEAAPEITVEANPDSVTPAFASVMGELRGSRVSLGAQSFDDRVLHVLGRRHDAASIAVAVEILRAAGVGRLGLDLIYGVPGQTRSSWKFTLQSALDLDPDHVSVYCLTMEPGTPMARAQARHNRPASNEALQRDMYEVAVETMAAAGLERYEISNFARPGCRSRHNWNYWRRGHYLGLGPGAHSFSGDRRWWNLPDVDAYCEELERNRRPPRGSELVTAEQALEETVMLALRTADGLSLDLVREAWGATVVEDLLEASECLAERGAVIAVGGRLRLAPDAAFVSDEVTARLLAHVHRLRDENLGSRFTTP